MRTVIGTLALFSSMAAWSTVEAAEYQCLRAGSSLRLAVEVKKAGHTLPCEVITENDLGERSVLYSAQFDRDYCPNRIDFTRTELEQQGWLCQKTSDVNVVYNNEAPLPTSVEARVESPDAAEITDEGAIKANIRTITESRQCRLGDLKRLIQIEVEDASSGRPCELVFWNDGDQRREGQVLWRAVHDASFCPTRLNTIVSKWVEDGWTCGDAGELQTAAFAPSPEEPAPLETSPSEAINALTREAAKIIVDANLQSIVEEDARRIGEWMEVEPDIEIAARGDLNDDGSEDAVVFLAYQSDQSSYRQYLMSYLVSGDGYELASVKLLTTVSAPPANARVDQIEDGVIWLSLPGDDGVEPTSAGYKLYEQQLIEVDGAPPTTAFSD